MKQVKRKRRVRARAKLLAVLLIGGAVIFAVSEVNSRLTNEADTLQALQAINTDAGAGATASEAPAPARIEPDDNTETRELPHFSVGRVLHSPNALLIHAQTGEVLFEQNATQRMYPASLVKMMTALVAIENIESLSEMVFLDESMFQPIRNANATRAGFFPNDSVHAIDLLFGLMLPSGAECAIGLAEHVAGSEDAFVEMMNTRAAELGMTNTNFVNTTGLHDSNQFSTAQDMAILLRYAMDNEVFHRIITAPHHSTGQTRLQPGGITFHSTLFSRMESAYVGGGTILGGRTGFTSQAGQNLASFAEIGGEIYILVTSGAQTNGNHLTQALHIEDAMAVYSAINR